MLTRLRISGFKNLVDTDVRFGPFTCLSGAGGTGKSSLLDALRFIRALTGETVSDAARRVLFEDAGQADLRSVFSLKGDGRADTISFAAEMIIPPEGEDPYGCRAEAGITFVRYSAVIGRSGGDERRPCHRLELRAENLDHINIGDAHLHLWFPHRANSWRRSVMHGRRSTPFITTETEGGRPVIRLNQDGSGGRPRTIPLEGLTRTALSTVNAEENPTATLVRQEIRSWRVFRLQPAALRQPDRLSCLPEMTLEGRHLPGTLWRRLSAEQRGVLNDIVMEALEAGVISHMASELLDEVAAVRLRANPELDRLELEVTDTAGRIYPAGAMGEGILRFLGVMAAALPEGTGGLVCIENPEHGQDPRRVASLVRFLHGIATDAFHAVGPDNALHQIMITTHSPLVVNQVPDDSLLLSRSHQLEESGTSGAAFEWLPDTWRHERLPEIPTIDKQLLREMLNPSFTRGQVAGRGTPRWRRVPPRRVGDRPDLQPMLPFWQRRAEED
jgi:predicted ATPase